VFFIVVFVFVVIVDAMLMTNHQHHKTFFCEWHGFLIKWQFYDKKGVEQPTPNSTMMKTTIPQWEQSGQISKKNC
jgi:hypothetical protein